MNKPSDEALAYVRQYAEDWGLNLNKQIELSPYTFAHQLTWFAAQQHARLAAENERLRQELARWEGWQDAGTPPPAENEHYSTFSTTVDVEVLMVARGYYQRYKNVPTFNDEWKAYVPELVQVIGWRYRREEGGEDGL